jgi:hypothetical protein
MSDSAVRSLTETFQSTALHGEGGDAGVTRAGDARLAVRGSVQRGVPMRHDQTVV